VCKAVCGPDTFVIKNVPLMTERSLSYLMTLNQLRKLHFRLKTVFAYR
jgi:hypothetical protein